MSLLATEPAAVAPPLPARALTPAGCVGREAVRGFVESLSLQSSYRRFFTGLRQVPDPLLDRLVASDEHHETFVATEAGRVVGHAMWGSTPERPGTVDVAVVVAEDQRRRGLGSELIGHAVRAAARRGAHSVVFTVLAENRPAVAMLRRAWPASRPTYDEGVLEYVVPLAGWAT